MGLSSKQLNVLDFIKRFIAEKGYAPTIREIMSAFDLKSPSTVQDHLKKLVLAGVITMDKNKSRTIELLVQNEYLRENVNIFSIPLLDNEYQNVTKEYIDIPAFMLNDYDIKNVYAYQKDNSLYIINTGLVLSKRLSVTIKDGLFAIEKSPTENIFGNVISEFKRY